MEMVKQKVGLFRDQKKKNAQDHAPGYPFPCKFKDRLFFADKKHATLNNAKLNSCKRSC